MHNELGLSASLSTRENSHTTPVGMAKDSITGEPRPSAP
jgi:hypothetical protein